MVEKHNELETVNNWKEDLMTEANRQSIAVVNSCMVTLKNSVSEYAKFAVQRIFDHIIDCLNAKLSV